MTEEEIKALQAKVTELEAAKTALVGETTDLRKARQDKETEIETLKNLLKEATEKNNLAPEDEKIAAVVTRVLGSKEQERAAANKKSALEAFVNKHKEYHPDNDPGGIKKAALERELANLNPWNTAVEVGELTAVIEKANTYLRGHDTPRQDANGNPILTPPNNPTPPKTTPDDELSPREQQLIDRNGWTKEKYLGLKAKMPDFVDSLLG